MRAASVTSTSRCMLPGKARTSGSSPQPSTAMVCGCAARNERMRYTCVRHLHHPLVAPVGRSAAAKVCSQDTAAVDELPLHSRFLHGGRAAPRLLAGGARPAGCSPLHATPALTDARQHGSGEDRDAAAAAAATSLSATAASSGSGSNASSLQAGAASAPGCDVTHSIDTYEDSLLLPGGCDGADAVDDALLCVDPMHSIDSTDVEDWGLDAAQGWGQRASSSSSRPGVAAACGGGGCSSAVRMRPPAWGSSMRCFALVPAARCSSRNGKTKSARAVAVAAAGGSSSSGSGSSGDDKNTELHRKQRRALEQLLLSIVVHDEPGRATAGLRQAGADVDVSGYEGADALRLLYPQLDPARSYDDHDVIDWSDVANDGWGSSSSSSSDGGSRRRCCESWSASNSSSSSCPHKWGGSMCWVSWLPTRASSRQRLRTAAAAIGAGAGAGGGGGAPHAEDAAAPASSYEGADAANDALCRPDNPLCEDPVHSPLSTAVEEWEQQDASAAPAEAARSSSSSAASGASHSVDLYEDSLLAPGSYEGADAADDALCRPDSPLCNDPMHSIDSTEVEERSSQPVSAWSQQQDTTSTTAAGSAAAGSAAPAGPSSSTSAEIFGQQQQQLQQQHHQLQQQERRPLMNIVNGRWMPPSRQESEALMRASVDMGPDEGL